MNAPGHIALAILSASLLTAARAEDDAKAIQGEWAPTSAELAGAPLPPAFLKSVSLEMHDGKYGVMVGAQPDKGSYRLDPAARPKSITILGEDGPNAGKTFPAIYELQGGSLRICYDLSGARRPEEFKTATGTKLYLVTYERKKQPADAQRR